MTQSKPHIPILRHGRPYQSLDALELKSAGTDTSVAVISQANAGLIRKDIRNIGDAWSVLRSLSTDELIQISNQAGEIFMHDSLSLGIGGEKQSPEDYILQLSVTSCLPHTLVRRNMEKIHQVFTEMGSIVRGLTRGLDHSILDHGIGKQAGSDICYYPAAKSLGVVLPSNSPGVNSIWMPCVILKIPVILKPGRDEPWTPWRIIQAFIAAGCPAEAFGFYPTDHEGASAILQTCDRSQLFGDSATTEPYARNQAVQCHGPGWSKVLIGEDTVDNWKKYIDLFVQSIAANGGRSCINASQIITPRHGREIADYLAKELARLTPLPADDKHAVLAGFANPTLAEYIDQAITEELKIPGAVDVSPLYRRSEQRCVKLHGVSFLHPTIIFCERPDHPLARREFLFPYASIVEVAQKQMMEYIGPTLAATALTSDNDWIDQLLCCPEIDRLNIGDIPTSHVDWDQPHEGNLFEFLYRRRAIKNTVQTVAG